MSRFEWIQKFVTFVFNVFRNLMSVWDRTKRQHRQICMEEEAIRNNVESDGETWNRGKGEDTVDFGFTGGLKDSLEKVSKAIYTKFVFVWHTPPEELQNQPLYKEINSKIQNVFFNIKRKAHPLEEYEIIISIASGFIAHFKNKREKKVTYRCKTRQEDVDFIRKNIKCLLDYWLPESMQRNQLIYVFITEVLSVNVLEKMINNFSQFTNINEAIVEALDDNPATEQEEDSGNCDEIVHDNTSDESYTIMESDITPRKIQRKEKKGLKKKIKGLIKSLKKKGSETEAAPKFRSYCADTDSDVGDNVDTGSTDDSEDDENPMTSIIDTSLQMWLQNNWTARVSKVQTEKEDEYEISVYDKSAPGSVLWKTIRCVEDFKLMYEKIYQKYSDFMNFKEPGRATDTDGQFFYSIGTTPDEFINILVNVLKKYKEREAVLFFSPFDNTDDDDGQYQKCLLNSDEEHFSEQSNTDDEKTEESRSSKIVFKTFNTQNEEEKWNSVADITSSFTDPQDTDNADSDINKSKRDEFLLESCDKKSDYNVCYQTDGFKLLRSRNKNKKYQSASRSEDVPSTDVTGHEEFPSENADRRTTFLNTQHQPPIIMDSHPQMLSQKVVGFTNQDISPTMEQQKKKLQETLLDVVYQLIDEVLAGGKTRVCFLHRNGFLKSVSKSILDGIPILYAEEQVIWYLEQVAELLMSPERTQQLTPEVLQSKALDILNNKVRGFLPYILKFLMEGKIMKNLKASHEALQDTSSNKATIYGILEDLTKIITEEGGMFNP